MSTFPRIDSPAPNVVQGIAPPHSIEAEQSVLGAVLMSEKTHFAYIIEERLRAEDFYRDRHRLIYESMMDLYAESTPIDVLTVTEHLRARSKLEEAGGAAEIEALTAAPPAIGHLRRYGQIVKELSVLRRLLTTTYEIQASVHNRQSDVAEIVEIAERSIFEVAHDESSQEFHTIGSVLDVEVDRWHRQSLEGRSITGTTSGFRALDEITGGFQPGALTIIAARPGMGKSALVTNMAESIALDKADPRPVALFSLEMSEAELAQRFVASQAGIKGDDLRKGRLKDERKWQKIAETVRRFDKAPLYVDDSADLSILDIRAKSRRLASKHAGGLGVIIVDYIQLLRADGRIESRVQQVGEMSRGLKVLAGELNVPVIALSQLSRSPEARTDKRPMLSDLRESGNLEQDADLVMFIYRDEYYNKEDSEALGLAELIIAKHRAGAQGTVELTFQAEYPRFLGVQREAA